MYKLKNKVQLIGHLGAKPETTEFDSGKKVTKLRIATSDSYKNKAGERVDDTQWHNVVAWGKTGELMSQLLDKGNQLALEGKLQYRTYEDKEGNTKYITEIVANEFVKLTKETKKEDLPF